MAEALATHLAADAIKASSAGLIPLGHISPHTRTVLAEIGVSCTGQTCKQLDDTHAANADLLVNMAGRALGIRVQSHTKIENWEIADPFGSDLPAYRTARDKIMEHVLELAARLRASLAARR